MNSIPENVKVACSYQDEYYEYINSADSSGSPYTVEVGAGVNVDNYIAKDSENRICFTSTNCASIINTISAVNPTRKSTMQETTIQFITGMNYTITEGIKLYSYTRLVGPAIICRSGNFVGIQNINSTTGNTGITLKDITVVCTVATGSWTQDLMTFTNPGTYTDDGPTNSVNYPDNRLYQLSLINVECVGSTALFAANKIILATSSVVPYIDGLYIHGASDTAISLTNSNDGYIHAVTVEDAVYYNLKLINGNANELSDLWFTSGRNSIYVENSIFNTFTNVWSWSASQSFITLISARGTQMSTFNLRDGSSEGNFTYPYVSVTNTTQSVFTGFIMQRHGSETYYPSYGVLESGTSGYNLYANIAVQAINGTLSIAATSNSTNVMAIS
jgi:hypothetical protein